MTSIVSWISKEKGTTAEKPWGGGCVSSAVLVELEKNGGKFPKFGKEQADEDGKHVFK